MRFELEEWAASAEAEARLQHDESSKGTIGTHVAAFTPATLASQIVEQCEEIVKRHEAADVAEYVDDGAFRSLVNEMLDTKAWASEKVQLWMHDPSQYIRFLQVWSLRDCHRMWQAFLRRRIANVHTISSWVDGDC